MALSKIGSFAAGAVVALVLGSGTAVAATGGKFILGKGNAESSTSTLTNTRGTALSLRSKAGTPALQVGNSVRVPSLNSDKLDGLDSSSFARATGQAGSIDAQGQLVDFDGDGTDDAVMATATCPSGTQLTGGGAYDGTDTGQIWASAPDPDLPESWTVVIGIDGPNEHHATESSATAVCYNPLGAVPQAYGFSARRVDPLSRLSPQRVERLREQAAARTR
jgi:hypothetical protein